MIVIVDAGTGNLRSLMNALTRLGLSARVEERPPAARPDTLILPGVGAFGHAAEALRRSGWDRYIQEAIGKGTRLVGICLGMQLLFESSEESADGRGLALLPGRVRRLDRGCGKIPHIGWSRLEPTEREPAGPRLRWAYFVHSFVAHPEDPDVVSMWASHGGGPAPALPGSRFAAVVRSGNVVGMQFHPEKSQGPGLDYLRSVLVAEGGP